jgi:HK97 family phage major capsid protein
LATAPTDSNKVRVIVETVADPGSIGTVDEGALKPEATLTFDEVDEPVRKVASFLPASDEMISDAPGLRAYLNSRLGLFVAMEEENQLLNGLGAGTDLDGLLNRVPLANQGVISDATAANAADHIHAAFTVVRASFLEPDGVVINPADWDDLRLLKDNTNNYLGGSPFSNGGPQPGELLFGKRVVVTSAIAQGSALVGAFATAATIYRRGGLIVEASNSHEDFFQRDMTAIRAVVRLALGVARPEAFATCDLSSS